MRKKCFLCVHLQHMFEYNFGILLFSLVLCIFSPISLLFFFVRRFSQTLHILRAMWLNEFHCGGWWGVRFAVVLRTNVRIHVPMFQKRVIKSRIDNEPTHTQIYARKEEETKEKMNTNERIYNSNLIWNLKFNFTESRFNMILNYRSLIFLNEFNGAKYLRGINCERNTCLNIYVFGTFSPLLGLSTFYPFKASEKCVKILLCWCFEYIYPRLIYKIHYLLFQLPVTFIRIYTPCTYIYFSSSYSKS